MASSNRRAKHISCRVRGKVLKGNNPRSTKPARWKYECNGVLVAPPTGHKKYGWAKEFAVYKPLLLKGASK